MLIKLTLSNGATIWLNGARLVALHDRKDAAGTVVGSRVVLDAGDNYIEFDLQETAADFFDRTQGRGGVDIPKQRIVTP